MKLSKKKSPAPVRATSISEILGGSRRYSTDNPQHYEAELNSMSEVELSRHCIHLEISFSPCESRQNVIHQLLRQFSLYWKMFNVRHRENAPAQVLRILSAGR
jgi:hypothetical protein